MSTTPTAPAFPVIEIDGRKLVLKFDFLAKFRMSELGVGVQELRALPSRQLERPEDADPRVLAVILKLFSCFVASNYISREDPGAPAKIPSPEYWAAVLQDDMELWGRVCAATGQALGKVVRSGAAPAPATDAPSGAVIKTN